jgi:hypothetical protein
MEAINIIAYVVAGIVGLWGLIKLLAPKWLDARLEDIRDRREFDQEQNRLTRSYQQAESAVAQQMLMELLASLQEGRETDIEFIKNDVREALDKIKADSSLIPVLVNDFSKRLLEIEYQVKNLVTYYKILTGLLDDFHQKYERDRRNDS